MTDPILRLHVVGVPVPQGSMSGFPIKRANGTTGVALRDQKSSRLKPWREAIRSEAVAKLGQGWTPVLGPVRVRLIFALPKPTSAPKTRQTWPIGARSGDVDKLARAVLDAFTDAAVWRDDGQVTSLTVLKDYPTVLTEQTAPGLIAAVWAFDRQPSVSPLTPTEGVPTA